MKLGRLDFLSFRAFVQAQEEKKKNKTPFRLDSLSRENTGTSPVCSCLPSPSRSRFRTQYNQSHFPIIHQGAVMDTFVFTADLTRLQCSPSSSDCVTIFFCDSGLFYLFNATLKQK
jgi:hypothetical protein